MIFTRSSLSWLGLCAAYFAVHSLADEPINPRLVPATSPYERNTHFQLVWDASASGMRDEAQVSKDLVTWRPFRREFPSVSPLHQGISSEIENDDRFFRVVRWEGQDSEPPAEVVDLEIESSEGELLLSWTEPGDSDVLYYEVMPEGSEGSFHPLPKGTTSFSFTPTGEPVGMGATVRVVDESGNRSGGVFVNAIEANPPFPEMKLIVSPSGVNIGRTGATTMVARLVPPPERNLRFEWTSPARLGTIDGEDQRFGAYVQKYSTTGSSQAVYTPNLFSNPGGIEYINVRIFDHENGFTFSEIADATISLEVDPPRPQNARFRAFETTEPGTIDGRQSTYFGSAWVIKKEPGFSTYVFTLLAEPGEGTDYGPLGVELAVRSGLQEVDDLIANYGSNVIDLLEDEIAWVAYGSGSGNYDPTRSRDLERLQAQRELNQRIGQAAFSVVPRTNYR